MDNLSTNIISYAELKTKRAMMEKQKSDCAGKAVKLPAFRMKPKPLVCDEMDWAEEEDWSCEWCGEGNICTWQPEECIEEEEIPCCTWEGKLEDREFLVPLKAGVFNLADEKIGEVSGWLLNPDTIISYEHDSFFAMDGISHLLMCAHHLIIDKGYFFIRKSGLGVVPFVTRLSLYDEFRTLEVEGEVLNFLLEGYGAIIYSLGYTELDDDNFFEYQDNKWYDYWEGKLSKHGWRRDDELWYAFSDLTDRF